MLLWILPGTFIVMIGIIWFNEGWKKALKIIGIWLGSILLCVVLMTVLVLLGFKIEDSISRMVGLLLWGGWVVWLVIYNIKEGYIGKF